MRVANKVIAQADTYGFTLMEELPDPNIHKLMVRVRIAQAALDVIIDSEMCGEVVPDSIRLLINAKELIWLLEKAAVVLIANDRDAFDEAIAALRQQAPF